MVRFVVVVRRRRYKMGIFSLRLLKDQITGME